MFKIAIIIFRESFEIAILLGIIIAVTKRIQNSHIYIIAGVIIGSLIASIFAFFARILSVSFGGVGDEIVDATIILLTVVLICWTIFWMKGQEGKLKQSFGEITEKINSGKASCLMLTLVVAMVILREGAEIILFIYSITSVEKINIDDYVLGLAIGAISGLAMGIVVYLGLIRFAGKYIFKICSFLLVFIAAGLASEAAGILTSAGIIENFSDPIWDTTEIIADSSVVGQTLNIIAGYTSRPNGMQLLFYCATLAISYILTKVRANYR